MEQLKKRVANLASVKSIVTIALTAVFAVLALRRDISGQNFLTIFLMVISFYFGTQSQKVQDAIDSTEAEGESASAGSEGYGGREDDE